MLFFTRAFLCIGTIVVLAEGLGPTDVVTRSREAASTVADTAAGQITGFCRSRPKDCLDVAGLAASRLGQEAADGPAVGPRKSHAPVPPSRSDLSLPSSPPR